MTLSQSGALSLFFGAMTTWGIVTWNAPLAAFAGIGFGFVGGVIFMEKR